MHNNTATSVNFCQYTQQSETFQPNRKITKVAAMSLTSSFKCEDLNSGCKIAVISPQRYSFDSTIIIGMIYKKKANKQRVEWEFNQQSLHVLGKGWGKREIGSVTLCRCVVEKKEKKELSLKVKLLIYSSIYINNLT